MQSSVHRVKPSTWKLPVFFHNLRGYDTHMLIRALKRGSKCRISPTNFDKYMSIQVGKVLFLDSMQFTLQGLENLVSTLRPEDLNFTTDYWNLGKER